MAADRPSAETPPAERRARYGLPPDATLRAIRHAHRRARQTWHPDKHTHASPEARAHAAVMYGRVEEDFAILTGVSSDPYQERKSAAPSAAPASSYSGAGVHPPSDPFASSRSAASHVSSAVPPPLNVHEPVRVSLADVWRGALVNIDVALQRECSACDGRGCPRCHGGMRLVQGRVRVRLPAGIRPGTVLHAAKMGHDTLLGPRGDGLFTIFWSHRRGWRLRVVRPGALSLEKTIRIPSWTWHVGRVVFLVGPDNRVARVALPARPARSVIMTVPSWDRSGTTVRVRLLAAHFWAAPFWPLLQVVRRVRSAWARWRASLPPTGWIHRPPPDGV